MITETPDPLPKTGKPMRETLSPILTAPDFEAAVVQRLPAWWRQGQQQAWNSFQELPFPHGKSEQWRFASTGKLKLEGYYTGIAVSSSAQQEIQALSEKRETPWEMAFANDQLLFCKHPSDFHKSGVIFCSLEQALHRHPDLVKEYFLTQVPTLGGEKLNALHRSHGFNGLFLWVPDGVELSEPIDIFYWLTEAGAASFPYNLVVAGRGSKVQVRFYYRCTTGAEGGFLGGVSDFIAGAGANLRNVHIQQLSEKALVWQQNSTVIERDAQVTSLHLNLGGSYARLENRSRLIGPGGRSEMLSLTASHHHQEFDQRTFQEHAAPHTTSDLLYKNALADHSRTIFAGMIDVDPQAQQTNAYQSNRNLLLNGTAESNSLPGLEIMANDVRCTHGSTTGQINDAELFYMLQRGIPLYIARRLFVIGFFDEVITRLNDVKLGMEMHHLVESKFEDDRLI